MCNFEEPDDRWTHMTDSELLEERISAGRKWGEAISGMADGYPHLVVERALILILFTVVAARLSKNDRPIGDVPQETKRLVRLVATAVGLGHYPKKGMRTM